MYRTWTSFAAAALMAATMAVLLMLYAAMSSVCSAEAMYAAMVSFVFVPRVTANSSVATLWSTVVTK